MADPLVNYLRARRKGAGLSQLELAQILGYESEGPVSRHELFQSVPPLIMALAYEIVFQAPISELFVGLREAVETGVEKQIAEFEARLLNKEGNRSSRQLAEDRRKLEWVRERRKMSFQ